MNYSWRMGGQSGGGFANALAVGPMVKSLFVVMFGLLPPSGCNCD